MKSTNVFDVLRPDTDTDSDDEGPLEDVSIADEPTGDVHTGDVPNPVPQMRAPTRSWADVAMAPPKPIQPRDPWTGFDDTQTDAPAPPRIAHGSVMHAQLEDAFNDYERFSDDDLDW